LKPGINPDNPLLVTTTSVFTNGHQTSSSFKLQRLNSTGAVQMTSQAIDGTFDKLINGGGISNHMYILPADPEEFFLYHTGDRSQGTAVDHVEGVKSTGQTAFQAQIDWGDGQSDNIPGLIVFVQDPVTQNFDLKKYSDLGTLISTYNDPAQANTSINLVDTFFTTFGSLFEVDTVHHNSNSTNDVEVKSFADGTALSGLDVPGYAVGGNTYEGTVYLNKAAPSGGFVVSVFCNRSETFLVGHSVNTPLKVTVPAGATSAHFTIQTTAVSQSVNAIVTAEAGGVRRDEFVTERAAKLSSATVSPNPVKGGNAVTIDVGLDGPAAADLEVAMTSDHPELLANTNFPISKGGTKGGGLIFTSNPTSDTVVTLTFEYPAGTKLVRKVTVQH
jgi:hypothetical protein